MWVELKDEPLDHSLRRFRVATLTTIGLELEVEYDDGSSELCAEDDVFPCNDHEHEEAPADHCALEYLSEAAVLHSTRTRLKDDEIYTYVGPVLLAINPQKVLKRLYAERAMEAARAAPTVLSGPTRRAHPFTEAELAARGRARRMWCTRCFCRRRPSSSTRARGCRGTRLRRRATTSMVWWMRR